MNRSPTQKRQRQALGEASLPDPQSLLRAPAYPPAAGLQVGQIQKQARFRKNAWVWEQFDKRPVPAAGAAAAEGDQEMAEEEEAAAAPAPAAAPAAAAAATTAAAAMEVKYACKHCPNVRSAHEARMKEHLLNIKICGFLSSTAAAECPAEEVQSKLKSLRQSSSSTTHLNFLTEAFKVWTVPHAVPYFTVYTV